jgi:hypothetical protein
MMLADTIGIFLFLVGVLIAFPALWLLSLGLWTRAVTACAERNSRGLIKSFFVGLPIIVVNIVIMGLLGKLPGPVGQLSPLLDLSVLFLYSSVGVAGLATMLGSRLPSPADAERPWKATLRGGIVLVLSFLFPILGWFLVLPFSLVIGCGTLTRVLLVRGKPKASPPDTAPPGKLRTAPCESGTVGQEAFETEQIGAP